MDEDEDPFLTATIPEMLGTIVLVGLLYALCWAVDLWRARPWGFKHSMT